MTQFVKFLVKLLVDVAVMFDVFEKRERPRSLAIMQARGCGSATTTLWLILTRT